MGQAFGRDDLTCQWLPHQYNGIKQSIQIFCSLNIDVKWSSVHRKSELVIALLPDQKILLEFKHFHYLFFSHQSHLSALFQMVRLLSSKCLIINQIWWVVGLQPLLIKLIRVWRLLKQKIKACFGISVWGMVNGIW